MIVTRKIELWIDSEDKDVRKAERQYWRDLAYKTYRAANLIINHLHFKAELPNKVLWANPDLKLRYLELEQEKREANPRRKKEVDVLLKQVRKQAKEETLKIFLKSEQQNTYDFAANELEEVVGALPSYVMSSLQDIMQKNYAEDLKELLAGKRTVRTYKLGMPIPFQKTAFKFFSRENGDIGFTLWEQKKMVFHFGRDRSSNKTIVERVIAGQYKLSDSSIQVKDGKLFLLLCVDIPNDPVPTNPDLSVGVDLGINVPAYCALSEGYDRLPIGSRDEFLKKRLQLQAQRKRMQAALRTTSGGHGRTKKLAALERLSENERNWVRTYNHQLTHRIVEFAAKHGAARIKLELLEGFGRGENLKQEKGDFLLRNWSYFEVQSLLKYKAARRGIEVVFIDPYHTSQACSVCGNDEPGQRINQANFQCRNPTCKSEGKTESADYNAARNIAKSTRVVSKKEDCIYYQKQLKENE